MRLKAFAREIPLADAIRDTLALADTIRDTLAPN